MTERQRVAYRVGYDGRPYAGFQRQPQVETVEGALFEALAHLDVVTDPSTKPAGYSAAGRTDAGVSAIAQTIAIDAPAWLTPTVLSNALPNDIFVWASAPVDDEFHATHHATQRSYVYFLHAESIDIQSAREAVNLLDGYHDFHNLTPDANGTRRRLTLRATVDEPWLVLRATASGFPRELVRRIANVVLSVGTGAIPLDQVGRLLSADAVPGHLGIGPAPPGPLVLADVRYPSLTWEVDEAAQRDALETVGATYRAAMTRAKLFRWVTGELDTRDQ